MKLLLSVFSIFSSATAFSQNAPNFSKADSLYNEKAYDKSAVLFSILAKTSISSDIRIRSSYNAACSYALIGDTTNAFKMLQLCINEGYIDTLSISEDKDMASLHRYYGWNKVMLSMKKKLQQLKDPKFCKIITTDIDNYWIAYESIKKRKLSDSLLFRQLYFNMASDGLKDYLYSRIGNIDYFITNQNNKKLFYASIKQNSLKANLAKTDIKKGMIALKKMYCDAIFPDIYFVIGAFNSAGTVSPKGLLIGMDMFCKSDNIPTNELNDWEKSVLKNVKDLAPLVIHELIHSNQHVNFNDETLLAASINEGMCDFIAEKCTGSNPNQIIHNWAKGKEAEIFSAFKLEMFTNNYNKWLYNGEESTSSWVADLGYYMGYKIVESFYINTNDKTMAIQQILNIKDYKQFLTDSKLFSPN